MGSLPEYRLAELPEPLPGRFGCGRFGSGRRGSAFRGGVWWCQGAWADSACSRCPSRRPFLGESTFECCHGAAVECKCGPTLRRTLGVVGIAPATGMEATFACGGCKVAEDLEPAAEEATVEPAAEPARFGERMVSPKRMVSPSPTGLRLDARLSLLRLEARLEARLVMLRILSLLGCRSACPGAARAGRPEAALALTPEPARLPLRGVPFLGVPPRGVPPRGVPAGGVAFAYVKSP